jgi:hypothetical protein
VSLVQVLAPIEKEKIELGILNQKRKCFQVIVPMAGQTLGRSKNDRKLCVLISAEIREHKLASQTLLLA